MREKEFEALKNFEDEKPAFNILDYKSYIYSFVFYICGLVLGSVLYKQLAGESINKLLSSAKTEFLQLFINDFCLYFSIFLVTMFLGFCMIGFPLINLIPLCCGFVIGMKVAYYYVNYTAKGVVYCLLMVLPAAALLLTVITMTIKISTDMSKHIFDLSVKKSDITEIDIRSYLKKYLIIALIIVLTALFNAGVTSVFSAVITI